MSQRKEGPKFRHDCTRCVFLGHVDGMDLYFCKSDDGTVVARRSNDGKNYSSMPVEVVSEWKRTGYQPANRILFDALKLAREKGCVDA